ncbi:unnamed protein product, partial [marine sediment metagenome]
LRLVKLGERIATSLGIDEKVRGILKEAAYLCKTDLTTQMVKEFPSLEGIMGKEYAEKRTVYFILEETDLVEKNWCTFELKEGKGLGKVKFIAPIKENPLFSTSRGI